MKNEKINIGDFTEQITWRQPAKTTGSMGNINRSYTNYKTDYVDVVPVTLGENEISGRMQYSQTYVFTAHYDANINNKYQIIYESEDYNIIKLEKLNLKRFLRVTATKIED